MVAGQPLPAIDHTTNPASTKCGARALTFLDQVRGDLRPPLRRGHSSVLHPQSSVLSTPPLDTLYASHPGPYPVCGTSFRHLHHQVTRYVVLLLASSSVESFGTWYYNAARWSGLCARPSRAAPFPGANEGTDGVAFRTTGKAEVSVSSGSAGDPIPGPGRSGAKPRPQEGLGRRSGRDQGKCRD